MRLDKDKADSIADVIFFSLLWLSSICILLSGESSSWGKSFFHAVLPFCLASSSLPFLSHESKNQFRRQKSTIHKRMCGQWRHLINLQSSCAVLLILFHHSGIMLAKKRRRWLININSFSKVVLDFFITSLQLNSSQVVEKRKTEGNDLWWKTETVVQSAKWLGWFSFFFYHFTWDSTRQKEKRKTEEK